jgi:ABC-type iron transport system FetAB ATPase subunit
LVRPGKRTFSAESKPAIQAARWLPLQTCNERAAAPNQCGKSTLLNMIAGIIPRSGGSLMNEDRSVDSINQHVGYLTQADSVLPWRTAGRRAPAPRSLRS